jgi:hypothetical protein
MSCRGSACRRECRVGAAPSLGAKTLDKQKGLPVRDPRTMLRSLSFFIEAPAQGVWTGVQRPGAAASQTRVALDKCIHHQAVHSRH